MAHESSYKVEWDPEILADMKSFEWNLWWYIIRYYFWNKILIQWMMFNGDKMFNK